ncbi:hypothetical protein KW783_02640 [Candidatus Parcubacteria bacterium]|nr:hypothetical protein [Candidatus Parcubacteria bacterium]
MEEDKDVQIAEYFKELPHELKAAIVNSEWENKLQRIVQKHQLHIDQAGILETETLLVMVGLQHPNKFVENLRTALSLPGDEVSTIARDINDAIFKDIKAELQVVHEEKISDDISVPPAMFMTRDMPIEAPKEFVPTVAPVDFIPKPSPLNTVPTVAPNTLEQHLTVPNTIEDQKLSGFVKMPTEKEHINETILEKSAPTPEPTPAKYSVDPYREPIS